MTIINAQLIILLPSFYHLHQFRKMRKQKIPKQKKKIWFVSSLNFNLGENSSIESKSVESKE